MLWPTVVFPLSCPSYGEQQYGSYCQGLALEDGARSWAVLRRDLEIDGQDMIMAVPDPLPPCEIPSTVVIEEVYDDGMSCSSIPSNVSVSSTAEGEDGYVMV